MTLLAALIKLSSNSLEYLGYLYRFKDAVHEKIFFNSAIPECFAILLILYDQCLVKWDVLKVKNV